MGGLGPAGLRLKSLVPGLLVWPDVHRADLAVECFEVISERRRSVIVLSSHEFATIPIFPDRHPWRSSRIQVRDGVNPTSRLCHYLIENEYCCSSARSKVTCSYNLTLEHIMKIPHRDATLLYCRVECVAVVRSIYTLISHRLYAPFAILLSRPDSVSTYQVCRTHPYFHFFLERAYSDLLCAGAL